MAYETCPYLQDKTCIITREGCPFWANTTFQEHCEKAVRVTLARFHNGRKPPEKCKPYFCPLTEGECRFRDNPALREDCATRIGKVWRRCEVDEAHGADPIPR